MFYVESLQCEYFEDIDEIQIASKEEDWNGCIDVYDCEKMFTAPMCLEEVIDLSFTEFVRLCRTNSVKTTDVVDAIVENITEDFFESHTIDLDWNDDYRDTECNGIKDLNKAIAFFIRLNAPFWWIIQGLVDCERLNLANITIGAWILDRALNQFELAQRDRHFWWYPTGYPFQLLLEESDEVEVITDV